MCAFTVWDCPASIHGAQLKQKVLGSQTLSLRICETGFRSYRFNNEILDLFVLSAVQRCRHYGTFDK